MYGPRFARRAAGLIFGQARRVVALCEAWSAGFRLRSSAANLKSENDR